MSLDQVKILLDVKDELSAEDKPKKWNEYSLSDLSQDIAKSEIESINADYSEVMSEDLKQCNQKIQEAINERNKLLAEYQAAQQEEITAKQAAADAVRPFVQAGNKISRAILKSQKDEFVDIDYLIYKQLNLLENEGYDTEADDTIALLFDSRLIGSDAIDIQTSRDFWGHVHYIEQTNKYIKLGKAFDVLANEYNVIHDIPLGKGGYEKLVAAQENIETKLSRLAETNEMGLAEIYARFFNYSARELVTIESAPLTSITDYHAQMSLLKEEAKLNEANTIGSIYNQMQYKDSDETGYYERLNIVIVRFEAALSQFAEKYEVTMDDAIATVFAQTAEKLSTFNNKTFDDYHSQKQSYLDKAQTIEADAISEAYANIKHIPLGDDYAANLISALQSVETEIDQLAERYGLSVDEAYATALGAHNIQSEADYNRKAKCEMENIAINEITRDISAFRAEFGKASDPEYIEKIKAIDLSAARLKPAGVSDETIVKIDTLKDAYITALESNEGYRDIESQIFEAGLDAQSEMGNQYVRKFTGVKTFGRK